MLGFLFKIAIVATVVSVAGYFLFIKNPDTFKKVLSGNIEIDVKSFLDTKVLSQIKDTKPQNLLSGISGGLDSLVTHNNKSPVVLGIKITNDSLNSIIDFIQNMPPEQVDQLKAVICAPAATPTPTLTLTPTPSI